MSKLLIAVALVMVCLAPVSAGAQSLQWDGTPDTAYFTLAIDGQAAQRLPSLTPTGVTYTYSLASLALSPSVPHTFVVAACSVSDLCRSISVAAFLAQPPLQDACYALTGTTKERTAANFKVCYDAGFTFKGYLISNQAVFERVKR